MNKLKCCVFFLFIFLIFDSVNVFAQEIINYSPINEGPKIITTQNMSENNIKFYGRGMTNESSELYHEKEAVVEVFNYQNRHLYLTDNDIYLMSQVVFAESHGEPYEGKVAVASVILNRVTNPSFPNSIEKVIKQKNAFSCVKDGVIHVTPDAECRSAVIDAIKGNDPTSDALFFYNPQTSTCSWMKQIDKKNMKTIGKHVFFQTKK
ncbi:cell wall hydrolase [Clostridium sp. C8-1-8]|uniref:cell wall hydrolase n=1 Tax=Clostridium sp. C8-1-8 TaxID=2698831 RepID=UPI001FAD71AE|nr:cell wall hydrolase [Clostridium sp. C8-1-8]